jgi:DNA-binding transcriptional LysR family regulator
MLRHTESILREMRAARSGAEDVSKWGHGRLCVGASTTACQHLLPAVLREFRESFPKCTIKIEPGDHSRQLELLRSGQVDLAILLEPLGGPADDLIFVPLFEDELLFFVAPQHPWARLRSVPREALAEETLILYNKASYTSRLVADYFRQEGTNFANSIELGSMEAIKELVKLGIGAGVLAPWIAAGELAGGTLVSIPLGARRLMRRWCVAYWKGRRLALAEEIFVGLCETVAKEVVVGELRAAV